MWIDCPNQLPQCAIGEEIPCRQPCATHRRELAVTTPPELDSTALICKTVSRDYLCKNGGRFCPLFLFCLSRACLGTFEVFIVVLWAS